MSSAAGEEWHLLSVTDQHRWILRARACVRASFPIQAGVLVLEVENDAADLWGICDDYIEGKIQRCPDRMRRVFAGQFRERADAVDQIATQLRARIQQMAEAL